MSIADGLPQSQVWAAINDSRGYLWFGTQGGGLSRYDGQDFEVFTTANGLPSNFIHAIYQEKDYSIWIGTNRGLSHFNGRSFQAIPNFQEQVNTIILQPDSSLMIGTESGLYRLSLMDTVVTKINLGIELDELSILSFCHYKGSLFVGTSNGLWEISDMVQQRYIGKQIFAIAPDNREQLWLADFGNGLLVYDTKTHEINEKIRTSSIYLTTALYHVNAIDLLIGTQNKGLIQFNKVTGETSIISEKDGLPHSHVRCLTEDINGRIWISTSGGGIACRLQQNFQHFTRKNGLIGSRIYAIHKDTAGNIWNAVSRNGIQILDSTGFQSILNEPQLQGIKCKSICSDGSGSVWIGTEGRGLFKQDTIGWIPINARDGLPSNWILKLLKDQQNGIWGATYGSGIFQTSYEDSLIIKTYANELPSKKMGTIQLDRLSRLWFATQNGILGFIDDQGNVQIPAQEGIAGIPIRSIAFDQYHQIWIGTKGEGIYFSQLDTLLAFTKLADIKPNYTQNVYQLFADSSSNIWAGSENGVERIELDSLGQIKNIFHFGKDDGFSGIETCHESYLLEEDGSIWFGTMNGLTHYKAGDITSQCHTPLLHFTSTELFYKSLDQTAWKDFYLPKGGIKSGLILPHKQNHLSFGFKAISQLQATDIEYRWKLNGTENDWSPPSKTTTVNYANLAPGDYSFEVQSALKNCNWSKSLRAAFTIKAPYWQEKWFIWSVASAALILLALSILAYVHRIKKQARLAQQKLEIENKVLQLEQKALQLQMNPHFIFNALTMKLNTLEEYINMERK
ncbi:MAG: two-component regulator propeller domain-containing protein, partial [Bacteroidota bacterium]